MIHKLPPVYETFAPKMPERHVLLPRFSYRRSSRGIAKGNPPKTNETDGTVALQGMVYVPSGITFAPGMLLWIALASATLATTRVVAVSMMTSGVVALIVLESIMIPSSLTVQ